MGKRDRPRFGPYDAVASPPEPSYPPLKNAVNCSAARTLTRELPAAPEGMQSSSPAPSFRSSPCSALRGDATEGRSYKGRAAAPRRIPVVRVR